MSLRAALDDVVADLPHRQATAILRLAQVLDSKTVPGNYWADRGRRRFERELAEDGIPSALIARVLTAVDDVVLAPVDLDQVLSDLGSRPHAEGVIWRLPG